MKFLQREQCRKLIPEVVYSDDSEAGFTTASFVAKQLGIKTECENVLKEVKIVRRGVWRKREEAVIKKPQEALDGLLQWWKKRWVSMVVCSGDLLEDYISDRYVQEGTIDTQSIDISLRPGECFIFETHGDWGWEAIFCFPTKRRKDVLVSEIGSMEPARPGSRNIKW